MRLDWNLIRAILIRLESDRHPEWTTKELDHHSVLAIEYGLAHGVTMESQSGSSAVLTGLTSKGYDFLNLSRCGDWERAIALNGGNLPMDVLWEVLRQQAIVCAEGMMGSTVV